MLRQFHFPICTIKTFLKMINIKPERNTACKGKILLLETYFGSLRRLSNSLTAKGYMVYSVGNIDTAIKHLTKEDFCLMLLNHCYADKLRGIQKNMSTYLPACLIFEDNYREEVATVVNTLVMSGTQNYLFEPLVSEQVISILNASPNGALSATTF